MGYNVHDVLRSVVIYYIKKLKWYKMILSLLFEIIIIFKDMTHNLEGIYKFQKFIFTQKRFKKKNMLCIGTIINIFYNNCNRFHSKIHS
jgi:hypothetical protein